MNRDIVNSLNQWVSGINNSPTVLGGNYVTDQDGMKVPTGSIMTQILNNRDQLDFDVTKVKTK